MFLKTLKDKKAMKELAPAQASLDDAMLLTGFGRYNISSMLLSGLILMGMIMETLGLSYVMPAAQCDLQISLHQKGWLGAVPFIAIILTSHLWGYLADTRGRRPMMLTSMATSVLLSVLSSFSPNLTVFAIMRFTASIFTSGPCGVTYAYLGEFNNIRHRDKMVAFGAAFVGIGTVVLPGISWLILPLEFSLPIPFLGIEYRPWRLLIVTCTIPYALGYILMLMADESPKFLYATGRYEECLQVLKTIYAVNKGDSRENFPVKSLIVDPSSIQQDATDHNKFLALLRSVQEQTVPLFKVPLLGWTCLSCFVQFGILAATNGFYLWFPTILNSLANADPSAGQNIRICDVLGKKNESVAANATQVLCDDSVNVLIYERAIFTGLVFCSMYIIVGGLVDLVGKKMILVVTLGITGLCGMGAHLVPNQSAAVALFAVFQMSGACIGLMTAVVVDLYPTKLRAMAVCLSLMMGRVGSVLGSTIIGLLLEHSCGASFYIFGGLLVACSVFCLTLPGKQRPNEKPPAPAGEMLQESYVQVEKF